MYVPTWSSYFMAFFKIRFVMGIFCRGYKTSWAGTLSWLLPLVAVFGCKQQPPTPLPGTTVSYAVATMTDVMVEDVTNPPLAARFFAYALLAGYEVVALHNDTFPSMAGKLRQLDSLHHPTQADADIAEVAALLAIWKTAAALQPTGYKLQQRMTQFADSLQRHGYPGSMLQNAQAWSDSISHQVLAYAQADGYRQISQNARYQPQNKPGYWYPTPPAFFPGVEPYFSSLRPMLLDSAYQYAPPPPVPFSADKNSPFFSLLQEVYTAGQRPEEKLIASFWDCNPFALKDLGHLMVGEKKISPGAHWMGICGITSKNAGHSVATTLFIQTLVAIGLFDSFISCWGEKYRSNRIRPETAIRQLLNPTWQPLLQTPPFPEYTSGHSVISTCSAVVLTHLLGQAAFTDTIEVPYGLPPRLFSSFEEAAKEAAISRLHGGIHFSDAISEGQVQGRQIGEHLLKRLGPVAFYRQ
jgi:hypothetical protein